MGPQTYKSAESPFTLNSIRWVMSMAKGFTAVATLQLIEQGKISHNQPLCEILPQFDKDDLRDITLFHLLTHTSELKADPEYIEDAWEDEDDFWEMFEKENWVEEYASYGLHCPVGTEWIYGTANYALLAEVIEKTTGQLFREYVTENVLIPMGMQDSWFTAVPEERYKDISFTSQDEEDSYNYFRDKTLTLEGSGGLKIAISDISLFGEMFLNKGRINGSRILSETSIDLMTKNQLDSVPAVFWGANYTAIQFGLGVMLHMDEILPEGSFEFSGSGGSYLCCDPVNKISLAWFVPMAADYVEEAHLGVMKTVWDIVGK